MGTIEVEVKVPQLAESVSEAVVLKWRKLEGQYVKKGDVLLDLETDKVVLEVPSDVNGLLKKIKNPERTVVRSGQSLAVIESNASRPNGSSDSKRLNNRNTPLSKKNMSITSSLSLSTKPTHAALSKHTKTHRLEKHVALSVLRRNLSQRLLRTQRNNVTLTTFNEVNMRSVIMLREKYKPAFTKKHGVKLGLTSLFVKASSIALKRFPILNASIKEDFIVYHEFQDIGVALNSPLGLIVPILRSAERMNICTVEKKISSFITKALHNRITIEEISGGTFTISNGGIYGSLLSTPVLNPPQSSILGVHSIEQRPIVLDSKIEANPMVYLALSYDHRLIDGKSAVTFLREIKEILEDPIRLMLVSDI